jgi:hypothetical protein
MYYMNARPEQQSTQDTIQVPRGILPRSVHGHYLDPTFVDHAVRGRYHFAAMGVCSGGQLGSLTVSAECLVRWMVKIVVQVQLLGLLSAQSGLRLSNRSPAPRVRGAVYPESSSVLAFVEVVCSVARCHPTPTPPPHGGSRPEYQRARLDSDQTTPSSESTDGWGIEWLHSRPLNHIDWRRSRSFRHSFHYLHQPL